MNLFLAAGIRRPKTVRTFLAKHLVYLLTSNLEEGAPRALTLESIDEESDSFLVQKDRRSASAAKRVQLKAKLQSYARSEDTAVEGDGWTLDSNLITYEGAVEHWLLKGRVTPL